MSRVNHSCLPNVQFSFEEDLPDDFSMSPPQDYAEHDVVATDAEACSYNRNQGIMLFHTIKDIPAGKEVMSNYESAYLLASDRQLKQQMHYGEFLLEPAMIRPWNERQLSMHVETHFTMRPDSIASVLSLSSTLLCKIRIGTGLLMYIYRFQL